MKKSLIILSVVLLLAALFTMVACSNVPLQSTLITPWDDLIEKSTYDVSYTENKETKTGSLVVTIERYKERPLTFNGVSITPNYSNEKFNGFVVTSNLQLADGQYKESVIITDPQFRSKYSLAKSNFKDKNVKDKDIFEELTLEIKYGTKSCDFVATGSYGDEKIDKKDTIKYKPFEQTAYFDNAFYIALTRTLGPINANRQLSFLTPSYRDSKMMRRIAGTTPRVSEVEPSKKLDFAKFAQPEDKKENKDKITCYVSSIASGETMPGQGTPINYFLSSVPYTTKDGHKVEHPMIKFIEHDVTYLLSDIEMLPIPKAE